MRQRTGNKGKEIKKGDMETETAGSERDRSPETEAGPQTDLEGRHRQRQGQGERELETLPTPGARKADAPCPLPTHILEERVSRGTGGWRGRPRGLGRGLPDQAHGKQPRARHGAAGSGWAEAPAPNATAAAGDWRREIGRGRPPMGAGAHAQGPTPTAPPTARPAH